MTSARRAADENGTQPPHDAPAVGMVSLGCPKALVDSERILSRLTAEGYRIENTYADADVVVVNTCGFLDSAKAESLAAIGEALGENGRVVVTGCLGAEAQTIREAHPSVLAVTGPQQYEAVLEAVHDAAPPPRDAFTSLIPPEAVRLTPRHYAYLKISEGCDHACKFCIIPFMRGPLASRPAGDVLAEAERLVQSGVKELLVVSQDTSAYGKDLRYAQSAWKDDAVAARFVDLAGALGELGAWVRLHYVYPYPHVDGVIPLMADGKVLPYLDIPFQHASASVLKAMARPANQEKTLARLERWRADVPDLAIRSTFIVGFPGETERDFQELLDWLSEAKIDRAGFFQYENVAGARANALPDHVPEDEKADRLARVQAHQAKILEAKAKKRVGQRVEVILDALDGEVARGRTKADAPGVDGTVTVHTPGRVKPGDIVRARVVEAHGPDLVAVVGAGGTASRRAAPRGRRTLIQRV